MLSHALEVFRLSFARGCTAKPCPRRAFDASDSRARWKAEECETNLAQGLGAYPEVPEFNG